MQFIIIAVLPLLIVISSVVMYHLNGKKEIFHMDMTQFLYTFIIGPVGFVWMKSLLFFLLRNELNLRLTLSEYLTIDTLFSVFFLFVYAFVVIHSLTKSFQLSTEKDDVFEFFAKSEFFHMDFSHYGIYLGIILLGVFLGLANLFFPFLIQPLSKLQFYWCLLGSGIFGLIAQAGMYLYRSNGRHFLRLIKFFLGIAFLTLACGYILLEPNFNSQYIVYWSILAMTITMVAISLFSEQKQQGRYILFRFSLNKLRAMRNLVNQ